MPLWDEQVENARAVIGAEGLEMVRQLSGPFDEVFPTGKAAEYDPVALDALRTQLAIPSAEEAVDRFIAGPGGKVRLRTFTPEGPARAVLLNFHGGGFIMGAPEMNDQMNLLLSRELGIAVVSVDYRVAPEHRYPAGHDDCETAALWLVENAEREFGTTRLLVSGDSAGANLAAVTLLRMRDRHDALGPFVGAVLEFGAYDLSHTPSSLVETDTDTLSATVLRGMFDLAHPGLSPADRRDADLSPLYADLTGLPPVLFGVGSRDHLVDDTLFMARRWELANGNAQLLVYPDAPHGATFLPAVAAHWRPRLLTFIEERVAS
nr:alpha/beta hydrolase [Streptomyces sp. NBC_00886]